MKIDRNTCEAMLYDAYRVLELFPGLTITPTEKASMLSRCKMAAEQRPKVAYPELQRIHQIIRLNMVFTMSSVLVDCMQKSEQVMTGTLTDTEIESFQGLLMTLQEEAKDSSLSFDIATAQQCVSELQRICKLSERTNPDVIGAIGTERRFRRVVVPYLRSSIGRRFAPTPISF